MYTIGILDDRKDDILNVERTILSNSKELNNNDIGFKEYNLEKDGINEEILLEEIIDDIKKMRINLLIIDYKILPTKIFIKGTNIFERIKKCSPDFPTVIMTHYPGDSLENDYIDPDKVYAKVDFFKGEDYTKSKTAAIIRNMVRYTTLRNNAEANMGKYIAEYNTSTDKSDKESQEIINQILDSEQELDKYTPVDSSYLEELIDPNAIKEILKELEKIENIIEK